MVKYGVGLFVFPCVQGFAFVAGAVLRNTHPWVALACFGLSSLVLCFSVHVTFHEAVHQKWFQGRFISWLMDMLMTLWIGLPLDGYRWHHFNHHRFNNTLDDYSCTWKKTSQGIVPQSPVAYILGWPVQMRRSQKRMDLEEAQGHLSEDIAKRMALQKYLLLLFLGVLAFYSWFLAAAYLACVYWGWVFVALENYAQHPPINYGVDTTTSYYDAFYNLVFCKNGFHAEHHRTASLPWLALSRAQGSRVIQKPYLLEPLFPSDKARVEERMRV